MKTALITGGAQGIGKATALAFLRAGYAVTILDQDEEAGHETIEEYRAEGELAFMHGDVSSATDVQACMDALAERHGRLDVLINNAGIFELTAEEDQALAQWQRMIGVNLTGAFLCARTAEPLLRRPSGCIINIASTRALMSEPHTEAYSASKGGLIALTHALAVSLGPEIRANCISPGWIDVSAWRKSRLKEQAVLRPQDHAQHPVGRVGCPEDVAAMALFLAGDEASFITGQNIVVDGGMTRKMIYVE